MNRQPTARALGVFACAATMSGCLTSNILVTVRPDGSGTIEHTATIRPSAMANLETLLPPEMTSAPSPFVPSLPATVSERLRWAAEWGPNVKLDSVRSMDAADSSGWKARYVFDDVRLLGIDLLPHISGVSESYRIAAAESPATTRLRMTLDPIGERLSRLTVHFPRFAMDPTAEPLSSTASGTPREMAVLRQVLAGARVTVAVQTEAPLIRTNSPHHEQSRVTVFDLDVPAALFSKQLAMLVSQPASFDEMLWAIEVLPGVRLAHDHDVTLDFEDPSAQPPSAAPPRAQPPPDTEIFLAALTRTNGKVTLGAPENVTNSPGYDNQPSFTPDGRQMLFTSVRGGPGGPPAIVPAGSVQTDVYRYDIASKRISRVTQTPESEYSPAVMPDGAHISVVRVEADGTQRLWSVIPSGSKISLALVLPDVKPVGYYAWVDDSRVALYVLGDRGQPATLQIADIQTGTSEIVARAVGRSIQRMPSGQISFVQLARAADGSPVTPTIEQLGRIARQMTATSLVKAVEGATDPHLAWMPDSTLLLAHGDTLYSWRPGDAGWVAVADLGSLGLRGVSRLAISPGGDRLALVGQPK